MPFEVRLRPPILVAERGFEHLCPRSTLRRGLKVALSGNGLCSENISSHIRIFPMWPLSYLWCSLEYPPWYTPYRKGSQRFPHEKLAREVGRCVDDWPKFNPRFSLDLPRFRQHPDILLGFSQRCFWLVKENCCSIIGETFTSMTTWTREDLVPFLMGKKSDAKNIWAEHCQSRDFKLVFRSNRITVYFQETINHFCLVLHF